MNGTSSKSMLLQELQSWLQIVVDWQQQFLSITLLLEQSSKCGDIVHFLENLKTALTEIGSIDESVQELPQVGQLLGRLTAIPGVMCHPKAYQALMACILFFYVPHPVTAVETRAQAWVVSQVRSAVCSSEDSDSNLLLRSTGVTQQQVHVETVKRMIGNMFTEIPSFDGSVDASSRTNNRHSKKSSLRDVCVLCLHLSEVPTMNLRLEKLVCGSVLSTSSEAENIYQILTESHKFAYIDKGCSVSMTYRTMVAIWTNYLPALEQEVLLLVDACCHLPDAFATDIQELLQTRHLIQACVEYVSVYETVFSILTSLYLETGYSTCIGSLISTLHRSIRRSVVKDHQKVFRSFRCSVPEVVRPLVSIMETSPAALSQSVCEGNLQNLSEQLDLLAREPKPGADGDGSGEDRGPLRLVCLQYREWADVALLVALLGSRQVCSACCHLALAFNSTGVVSNTDKGYLTDVVLALRALMAKSHLQWNDIQYALASNPYQTSVGHKLQAVLNQFLVVFITHSVGGSHLATECLEKVFQCESATSKLQTVLNVLDSVHEFWQGNLQLQPLRMQVLRQLLDTMERDVLESHTQDHGHLKEQFQGTVAISLTKCVARIKESLN